MSPTSTRRARQLKPMPSIPLLSAIGSAVIFGGVWVFVALASALTAAAPMLPWDQAVIDTLRAHVTPQTLTVFAALTHLADPGTLAVLCVLGTLVLLGRHQPGLAVTWVLAIAGNGVLNQRLKLFIGRARPLDPDGALLAQGFSFPSGHSSGAVVTYGMLAYLALRLLPKVWHLPALLLALALMLAVGASRVLLGVHFPSDVLAGFASGSVWLALCVTSVELVGWWQARRASAAGLP